MLDKAAKYEQEETALFRSYIDKVEKCQKKLEAITRDANDRVAYIQSAVKSFTPWQQQYDSIVRRPPPFSRPADTQKKPNRSTRQN